MAGLINVQSFYCRPMFPAISFLQIARFFACLPSFYSPFLVICVSFLSPFCPDHLQSRHRLPPSLPSGTCMCPTLGHGKDGGEIVSTNRPTDTHTHIEFWICICRHRRAKQTAGEEGRRRERDPGLLVRPLICNAKGDSNASVRGDISMENAAMGFIVALWGSFYSAYSLMHPLQSRPQVACASLVCVSLMLRDCATSYKGEADRSLLIRHRVERWQ